MIVICDLDGTVACLKKRLKKAGPRPTSGKECDIKKWLDKLMNPVELLSDKPIKEVIAVLQSLSHHHNIVYLTGRGEQFREITQMWMKKHKLPGGALFMRESNDFSGIPAPYKERQLDKIKKLYGCPGIALDDDDEGDTSAVYLKHGFIHLKVIT